MIHINSIKWNFIEWNIDHKKLWENLYFITCLRFPRKSFQHFFCGCIECFPKFSDFFWISNIEKETKMQNIFFFWWSNLYYLSSNIFWKGFLVFFFSPYPFWCEKGYTLLIQIRFVPISETWFALISAHFDGKMLRIMILQSLFQSYK